MQKNVKIAILFTSQGAIKVKSPTNDDNETKGLHLAYLTAKLVFDVQNGVDVDYGADYNEDSNWVNSSRYANFIFRLFGIVVLQ